MRVIPVDARAIATPEGLLGEALRVLGLDLPVLVPRLEVERAVRVVESVEGAGHDGKVDRPVLGRCVSVQAPKAGPSRAAACDGDRT